MNNSHLFLYAGITMVLVFHFSAGPVFVIAGKKASIAHSLHD